jgi:TonB family protein
MRFVAAVATAAIAAAAAPAAAEVTIVKGGPRADKGRVTGALNDAAQAMAVCWRGKPPAKVRIKLDVAADGAVTANAIGKGGAAQCAAGVLAVWTLPGGAWSGEVEVPAAAPQVDLASAIQQQLLSRSATIKSCQSKAPAAAGPVAIKMKIHPEGTISDVVVSSSLGAAIDGCVQKAVTALRLDALPANAPITYQLAVSFVGKDAGGGGGGDPITPTTDPDGGIVAGALDIDVVRRIMARGRAQMVGCGKKGKQTKGKVVVRFTVRPDGTTKNVVVKEPLGDDAIEACLVGAFKALEFPTASGETKVTYPVSYR